MEGIIQNYIQKQQRKQSSSGNNWDIYSEEKDTLINDSSHLY